MDERSAPCKALVLAGGGARGSYQVGVWRALMELDWHPQIITGTSVGSLNGAMFVLDQYETARDMWLAIRSKDVMELPEEDADLSALHQFLRSVVKAGGMDVTPLEEIVERVLDEGYIDNIAVDPNARRHGVADELLDVFCRFGAANLAFLTLEVRASNEPAIALYRKHGFEEAGRRKDYYTKPKEDAVIMTRDFKKLR